MSIWYLVQQHRLVVGRKIVTRRPGRYFLSYPGPFSVLGYNENKMETDYLTN